MKQVLCGLYLWIDGIYPSEVLLITAEADSSSLQSELELFCVLLNIDLAFSLWSIRPKDCRRRLTMVESSSPDAKALCLASLLHTLWAAGPQPPPSASHIIGINDIPSSWQAASVSKWVLLMSSYVLVAAEPSKADLLTMSPRRPLVTAMYCQKLCVIYKDHIFIRLNKCLHSCHRK